MWRSTKGPASLGCATEGKGGEEEEEEEEEEEQAQEEENNSFFFPPSFPRASLSLSFSEKAVLCDRGCVL